MRSLQDSPCILGKLAQQRYRLAAQNYKYLNPFPPGEVIPVLVFTGDKLVLLSGLLTVSLKGEITVDDQNARGPARPYRPYQFNAGTEPKPERENSYKVQAPLFPGSR